MYIKPYTLGQLKNFSEWASIAHPRTSEISDSHTIYLREDFTAYEHIFCEMESMVLKEITPNWMKFCATELSFPVEPYALHRSNKNFVWNNHGELSFLSSDKADFYDTYGYVVLENAFDEETINSVVTEIDKLEAEVEQALRKMDEGKGFIGRADEITFSTHLVKKSKYLRDFCCSEVFQGVSRDLVGPNVRLYWDHAVYKKPGVQKTFPWHQDNGYTFVEPQQYLTCWVALTDADEDNGCFWVTPFLHRLGTIEHKLTDLGHICHEGMPSTAVSIPAKKGDVVLMSAIAPHMTGPNYTSQTRKGYVIQFCETNSYAVINEKGKEGVRVPTNIEDRQFEILRDGKAVV